MSLASRAGRALRVALPAVLLGVFVLLGASAMRHKSATWDETSYFGLGKYLLTHGRWDVPGTILHPPLAYCVHDLPLLLEETDERAWDYTPEQRSLPDFTALADVERGQRLLSAPANDGDRLLNRCRLVGVLAAALLGLLVYRWAVALHGIVGGSVALGLFAFCPNMLAHAQLVTTDMLLTVSAFATVYGLWRAEARRRDRDFLFAGACLGLTLLAKYSGLLLLPVTLGLFVAIGLAWKRLPLRAATLFFAAGLLVFLAGYGFRPRPYLDGLVFQAKHASAGHVGYLFGEVSAQGWWYYVLVAFLVKTPIPTLILFAAGLIGLARNAGRRRWREACFLLLPVLAFFALFSVKHQSIGLRYVLPVYPFVFVLAGGVAAQLASRVVGRVALAALLGWVGASSIAIHPYDLAYFNEFAGGPDGGHRILLDSNLDWGQDLIALRDYMRANGIERIPLSYFGSDAPGRYGIQYEWLPSYMLDGAPEDGRVQVPTSGPIAVSATNLYGVYFDHADPFAWLRERRPVAKLGYSIFVYQLP